MSETTYNSPTMEARAFSVSEALGRAFAHWEADQAEILRQRVLAVDRAPPRGVGAVS